MILRALQEHTATDAAPFGYGTKKVGFRLHIAGDGSRGRISPLHERRLTAKGEPSTKLSAPETLAPTMTRSNNPPPILAFDTGRFVLGIAKSEELKDQADARDRHAAFVDLLHSAGEECPNTLDLTVVVAWFDAGMPGLKPSLDDLTETQKMQLTTENIAIRVEGSERGDLHSQPELQAAWSARLMGYSAATTPAPCVGCGLVRPPVSSLPQSLVGHRVPRDTQPNVALFSANFSAAQRGASGHGLRSAPVCAQCAVAAVSSLNDLLASPRHRWGASDDPTALVWWLKSGSAAATTVLCLLDEPAQPNDVEQALAAVSSGQRSYREIEEDRFHALELSGNGARLVVHTWIDAPLTEVLDHVRTWFEDTRTSHPTKSHPTLQAMASSIGAMRISEGHWRTPTPPGARESLLYCAIFGRRLPPAILRAALRRAAAEIHYAGKFDSIDEGEKQAARIAIGRQHARLSLFKLVINRSDLLEAPMLTHLDETLKDPVYISGRLFALRQRLQETALGKSLNASIADKYLGRALKNPASVEAPLVSLAAQHLRALRRDSDGPGLAYWFEQQIRILQATQGAAPARLGPEQSALWIAGYYQQIAHKSTRTPTTTDTIEDDA